MQTRKNVQSIKMIRVFFIATDLLILWENERQCV